MTSPLSLSGISFMVTAIWKKQSTYCFKTAPSSPFWFHTATAFYNLILETFKSFLTTRPWVLKLLAGENPGGAGGGGGGGEGKRLQKCKYRDK
jgi:hypothetical protein